MSAQIATNTVQNSFSASPVSAPTGASIAIEQQRAMTEAQASVQMAKMFPRDERDAVNRILMACTRASLAEKAVYAYNRGGSEITGPSIRLAEAIAQQWGNISYGIRELDQINGTSTVEAFAWDMQTNTKQVKVFQVKHIRNTKKGSYKLEDQRDIYEMVANNGARRLRACILGIIPGDVVEDALKQCTATMATNTDVTPDGIRKMVDAFLPFGVTKRMIEGFIQRNIDSIVPAQLVRLRSIYNSLKDGMSVASDWFDIEQPPETTPETKVDAIKDKLKAKAGVVESTTDPDTGEITQESLTVPLAAD